MKISISFDGEPEIGRSHELVGILGETAGAKTKATLTDLTFQEEVVKGVKNGRSHIYTYTERVAIFQREDGTRFKRIILPPIQEY